MPSIITETYHREKVNITLEQNKHVTNVIRYMSRHLDENLSLEDIVKEFDFSIGFLYLRGGAAAWIC